VQLLALLALSLAAPNQDAGATAPRNVAIVVYPGVELLDFAGPGEVFASAGGTLGRPAFRVYTVAETRDPLVSQGFVRVTPEFTYADCPAPDIVVVPGGRVPLASEALRAFVQKGAEESELVMSVCNGALALGAAGLLDGLEATTHHGSLERLQLLVPSAQVHSNRRYVDHGDVLTSAGVSAGIDGALAVVARLYGEEEARATARYMEYEWRPEEIAALHAQPGAPVIEPATEALLARLRADGVAAAAALYREQRAAGEASPGEAPPDEAALNRIGYALLRADRERARDVLALVVELFPGSANARDSLAEACELCGERERALAQTRRALGLLDGDAALTDDRRARLRAACRERLARLEAE
jgi:putative intracellular protease/amidase